MFVLRTSWTVYPYNLSCTVPCDTQSVDDCVCLSVCMSALCKWFVGIDMELFKCLLIAINQCVGDEEHVTQ